MDHPDAVWAVVLAGGASERMGTDKAMLTIDGVTLLRRLCRAAVGAGCPVAVVGREQPAGWDDPGVRFLPDDAPGLGPIGGLATALRHIAAPTLALACDLPRMDTSAIAWLRDAYVARAGIGLAAARGGEPEPLLAVYTPALLPLIERRIAQGRRSLKGVLDEAQVPLLETPAALADRLDGANTLDEWTRLVG